MYKKLLPILLLFFFLSACTDDERVEYPLQRQSSITLLVSVNALGDNGYNDCAVEGIFSFAAQTGTPMRLLQPNDEMEAERMYRQWLADNETADSSVLVVGSSAYEKMISEIPTNLKGKGSRVLLFESGVDDLPDRVSSLMIDRYGVSYLAGAMSGEFDALVMAAVQGYPELETAIRGFCDGHAAHCTDGYSVEVMYLADDERGFAMPDSAYRAAASYDNIGNGQGIMVFPLLGGSEMGVLRYMNDYEFMPSLLIGMDVDQTGQSNRIPFSMVIRIGDVVKRYLDDWANGLDWPKSRTWGMKDGATDIALTPNFFDRLDVWDWRYEEPDAFRTLYERYRNDAIEKEERNG